MELKKTLVNIVDFIDAKRIGKIIEVWDDFEAFSNYTLGDRTRRVNWKYTAEPLRGLLQRLRGTLERPARDPRTLNRHELRTLCAFNANSRVNSGRIEKRRAEPPRSRTGVLRRSERKLCRLATNAS